MSYVEEMIEAKIAKPKNNSVKFCVMEGRDAKSPVRAHFDDAGIDIFAPLDMEEVTIQPNEAYLVKTGLKCVCPKGYAMFVMNKSGVSLHFIQCSFCSMISIPNCCNVSLTPVAFLMYFFISFVLIFHQFVITIEFLLFQFVQILFIRQINSKQESLYL